MLNYIWVVLLIIGIIVGAANGRIDAVSDALLGSAGDAVTFCLGLVGVVALWCGLMQIFQDAGAIRALSKILRPLVKKLFPETQKSQEAEKQIITNLTANFLGLGNGATPSGVAAVQELQKNKLDKKEKDGKTATKSVCLFLVINSAAVQLIPTTVIAMRAAQGAQNPADILLPTWIVSLGSLIVGIFFYFLFSAWSGRSRKKRKGEGKGC